MWLCAAVQLDQHGTVPLALGGELGREEEAVGAGLAIGFNHYLGLVL